VPLHVEGSHIGEQGLSSANVARGLISSDVLLSSLHGHSESLISVHVLGDTHNTSWHLSLVLVDASEIAWMWTTISEWDTHSLSATYGDIGSHSTWWLDQVEGKNIGNDCEHEVVVLQLLRKLGEVLDITEVVWVLNHQSAIILCLGPWEIFSLTNMEVNTDSMALCLNYINGLWEQTVTDVIGIPLALVHIV